MSFGAVESEWNIDTPRGKRGVKGYRIGRFGVRTKREGEARSDQEPDPSAMWRVDHIPTGEGVGDFDDFETALAYADELSRFSLKDPASRNRKRALAQMGPALLAWAREVRRQGRVTITFREWLKQRGTPWTPRGRKWRR